MRFVLISTHVDQMTGYSKVVYNLLTQAATLAPKVKTFHFGFQRHGDRKSLRKVPEGIVAYDAAAAEDPKEEGFGFNKIYEYLEMVNPDVVMIYNDPMIIARFIKSMKYEKGVTPYKLWFYIDQVYTGIAPPLIDEINKSADHVYCFTDSWAKVFTEYPNVTVTPKLIEHAVDPNVFSSLPQQTRAQLRKNIGLPSDSIVFLNANRNSQRKRQDLTIMGFVRLLAKYQDKMIHLLMVTGVDPQKGNYYDIQRIFFDQLTLANLDPNVYGKRLAIIDTSTTPLTDEAINQIYNMSDIGVNTSDGEGFGLCQLEHLYTGAPQIVTDVGAYSTFLPRTVAQFIPARDLYYHAAGMPLGLASPTFYPDDVTAAMEKVVTNLPTMRAAKEAVEFKTWSTVCADWLADLTAST
jgi:glycosyltransferase involved in cell wall biosynthesis